MTVFDNRKAIWMWMFSAQAEQSLVEAAATARDLAGADILLVKAMDGLDWMARYDPTGYGSLSQFRAAAAVGEAQGVTVVPWVVPHGQEPAAEAAAHAQLGPVLMVDVEPYPGFWIGPIANLPVYLQALRAGGVAELHVSIDPRASAMATLDVGSWAIETDGLHPQVYWTNFGSPALSVLPLIRAIGASWDAPSVYPVLPGDGSGRDLAAVWTAAQATGCTGVSAWRLGSMDAAALENFRSLTMVAPTPPQPTLEDRVAALEAEVNRLNDVLTKRFTLMRVALDPDNPPA